MMYKLLTTLLALALASGCGNSKQDELAAAQLKAMEVAKVLEAKNQRVKDAGMAAMTASEPTVSFKLPKGP